MCKNGEWQQVTVDDWFPCIQSSTGDNNWEPVFSMTNKNELWLMILEKAFAKLNGGSYLSLRCGFAHEALQDLTGCPTLSYDMSTAHVMQLIHSNQFWPLIQKYL